MEESLRRVTQAYSPIYNPQAASKKLGPWGTGCDKQSMTLDKNLYMLRMAEQQFWGTGESTISVLHSFMHASFYNLNCPVRSVVLALELHSFPAFMKGFAGVCPRRASLFAAKLLANLSMKDGRFEDCREFMEDAITRPALGDLECRTRAMMLSNILCDWLEEWAMLLFSGAKHQLLIGGTDFVLT